MPRIVDHDVRRTELAAAACKAILRHGIDGLKLTDVGKEADVTTGTITHYFADKNSLMLAALEYAWNSTKERLCARLNEDEINGLEFFSEVLPINNENRTAIVVWYQFWLRGLNNQTLASRRREKRIEWLVMIETCLMAMVSRGEIVLSEDIRAEVVGVDVILNGIGLRAILDPDDWPAERQLAQLRRYFYPLRPCAAA